MKSFYSVDQNGVCCPCHVKSDWGMRKWHIYFTKGYVVGKDARKSNGFSKINCKRAEFFQESSIIRSQLVRWAIQFMIGNVKGQKKSLPLRDFEGSDGRLQVSGIMQRMHSTNMTFFDRTDMLVNTRMVRMLSKNTNPKGTAIRRQTFCKIQAEQSFIYAWSLTCWNYIKIVGVWRCNC